MESFANANGLYIVYVERANFKDRMYYILGGPDMHMLYFAAAVLYHLCLADL